MSDCMDRDYSTPLTIDLEWSDWTRIWSLTKQGIDKKEADNWPQEELTEDREIVDALNMAIAEESPGNGMADWPDSMKRAWDKSVQDAMEDL